MDVDRQRKPECFEMEIDDTSYEVADDETESKPDIYRDEIPMALCMVNTLSKQRSTRPYVVLFDSGSSHTWWNVKSLPKGAVPRKSSSSLETTTLAGDLKSTLEVDLEEVTFPEFF